MSLIYSSCIQTRVFFMEKNENICMLQILFTRNAWMYHPGLDKLVKIIVSFCYDTLLILILIKIIILKH